MQDWVALLTSLIQLLAACIIYAAAGREKGNKKGTPRKRRKRK